MPASDGRLGRGPSDRQNPNDAPRDPPPRSGVTVRLSATGVSGILPRSILGQLLSDDAVCCPSQAVSQRVIEVLFEILGAGRPAAGTRDDKAKFRRGDHGERILHDIGKAGLAAGAAGCCDGRAGGKLEAGRSIGAAFFCRASATGRGRALVVRREARRLESRA